MNQNKPHVAEQPPAQVADASISDQVARLLAGERRAIASAVTELERLSTSAPALLRALQPHLGRALVIGLTGPPGAGKSTLVNALIRHARTQNLRVGVIAVDPSSPISGGAILGDRIRMTAALDDDGVFVRSLASRGYLGGLSPAAVRIIDALDAAGFDLILLETVGTGQSEVDVAEVADIRIVISAPGLGDDIQAMKSGLLEIADILVVNKGDRDGAERTMQQLMGALSIRAGNRSEVPVLKTTATTGAGVPELMTAIEKIGQPILAENAVDRRRRRARYLIARAAADLVAQRIKSDKDGGVDKLADEILTGQLSPTDAARKLITP
ncbi:MULTISPECIES: methylmalonyl Co-A mutase-associated GTPase MeaB [Filomicrobium]|uniref:LAO/AO transport system kinase n=1 Tax=Filomicrobium insigne TaxID=418854 RepID=A0A1H0QZR6_9HYPH|nr:MULTISPECIES: methylmalonyl Co-A mutase-associated GTPase MeaB [Filomicrobium]MCV0369446.1 methylmalonyl Co-A mutase-associated GTPase MeaB [Filomicrobium sp.]SDP22717.1 LAO/AO transport system kinase [Filomicrobium insigne]